QLALLPSYKINRTIQKHEQYNPIYHSIQKSSGTTHDGIPLSTTKAIHTYRHVYLTICNTRKDANAYTDRNVTLKETNFSDLNNKYVGRQLRTTPLKK